MKLNEFIQCLEKVKGDNNQYSALCPAHDDKNASLSVAEGADGRILLKCQAGCTSESIVEALDLKMTDLFPANSIKKKVVAEYIYTDVNGTVVHKKIRYEPKGFTQAQPAENGKWIYNLKGVTPLLYNLPEVVQGIKDDKIMYVVEGEKDVETLKKHKKIATCNTHGAGEGKWLLHYNDYLKNASIIIIQDNDPIGKSFAKEIANNLVKVAKSVKIIDLTKIITDLPEHGDITDLFKIINNDTKALKLLDDLVVSTPPYEPQDEPKTLPYECDNEFIPLFENSGYTSIKCNTQQVIIKKTAEGCSSEYKPLCNFVAWCIGEKTIDDGADSHKYFELVGKHSNGRKLPQVDVTSNDFSNMNWITKMWGFNCNINAGSSIKDKLRHCIQQVSKDLKQETIFTYTGWREHDGKWIYLHGDGAVGADNINVNLDGKLAKYKLPGKAETIEYKSAIEKSMELMEVAPKRIIMPLLAFTFLSPINEFLKQASFEPKFCYFLMGKTGTGKSTIAALFLSFFGKFNNTDLPASFMDTANAIVSQTFLAKDNLICIDDYKPSNKQDVNRMDNTAQVILRSYGERTGRNRLKSDSTLMTQRAPRGNAIITGECAPNVGESGTARFIVSELKQGDANFEKLTVAQGYARNGDFGLCMRAYIEWLKSEYIDNNSIDFIKICSANFEKVRDTISKDLNGTTHPRIVEALSHLYFGFLYYMKFCKFYEVINDDIYKQLINEFYQIILDMGKEHAELSYTDKPSVKFMTKLKELIETKAVRVYSVNMEGEPFNDITL